MIFLGNGFLLIWVRVFLLYTVCMKMGSAMQKPYVYVSFPATGVGDRPARALAQYPDTYKVEFPSGVAITNIPRDQLPNMEQAEALFHVDGAIFTDTPGELVDFANDISALDPSKVERVMDMRSLIAAEKSNLRQLAADAISLSDPTACMEPNYHLQVAEVVELLASAQREFPEQAKNLDPTTLAGLMEQAEGEKRFLEDVLRENLQQAPDIA